MARNRDATSIDTRVSTQECETGHNVAQLDLLQLKLQLITRLLPFFRECPGH
jgi:hypothetical protein